MAPRSIRLHPADVDWYMEHFGRQPVFGSLTLVRQDVPLNSFSFFGLSRPGVQFEVLVGVGKTVLDRWLIKPGRNVTLWEISKSRHILRHSYGESFGPGWREAMLRVIHRAVMDGLSLEEA